MYEKIAMITINPSEFGLVLFHGWPFVHRLGWSGDL